MYVYVCMYFIFHECTCVCICVYVCIDVCVCMHVCMFYMNVCMHINIYICRGRNCDPVGSPILPVETAIAVSTGRNHDRSSYQDCAGRNCDRSSYR